MPYVPLRRGAGRLFDENLNQMLADLFGGGFQTELIMVSSKDDLPAAVGGVITLEAGKTYFVNGAVDLTGDRLEAGGILNILGASSETSSLTSTGLGASTPLLTSRYTMPVRFITLKDVGTGIYIDDNGGANAPLALDWLGVNFNNIPVIGEIGTVDNFVYDTGAFLSAQGLRFTGTIGTVALNNSLFSGRGSAGNIIEIASTATFTRRFRMIFSSVIAFGSTVGLNVSTSATIPVESYILDTINFGGGGTYTAGVAYDDNKARWSENRGVTNSASIANYYMNNNATATTISTANTPVKIAGTTTKDPITQRFTHTDNRATYAGQVDRKFKISANLTFTNMTGDQCAAYVAKNGAVIPQSAALTTASVASRGENVVTFALADMQNNDFLEVWIENRSGGRNVTVTDLNVNIEQIN